MTQDSLGALPFALHFFWLCIIVIGLVRLLRRPPAGNRPTTTIARRRGLAVATILFGIVALAITAILTDPPWRPLPGRHAPGDDTATVITHRVFDSHGMPAVHLEAPEGWRIEFDSAKQLLNVIQGSAPSDTAPTTFGLMSTLVSDEADPNRLLELTSKALEAQGLMAGASFVETIDGLRAAGRALHNEAETTCLWFVKRGPKFASALTCTDRTSAADCKACKPVLERIEWRELN